MIWTDGQSDKKSWLDPDSGLTFHNSKYNWNNPSSLLDTIEAPTTKEFFVDDDLSLFKDITPEAIKTEPSGLLEENLESFVVEDIEEPIPETLLEKTKEPEPTINYDHLRHDVNVGLKGLNQFFHGVIDKEFSGGFMGFNPVNKMAHSKIGDHMRMYENPDRITQDMIDNTRAMIIEKAGSQLGPEKTAYILERFNQYVAKITAYQRALGAQ